MDTNGYLQGNVMSIIKSLDTKCMWLVIQGFLQRPGINQKNMYSPVMDAITFRFWISLAVSEGLDMHFMDTMTIICMGYLVLIFYIKIPEGFHKPEAYKSKDHNICSIKLLWSLYGTPNEGHVNDPLCLCAFINQLEWTCNYSSLYWWHKLNWNS